MSSGSEFDGALCLGFCTVSLSGGEEKGDRIVGGCISLTTCWASGRFLGLACCEATGGGAGGVGLFSGLFGLGIGLSGGLLGTELVAAAAGVVTFSGENKDGGRVLCGGSGNWF